MLITYLWKYTSALHEELEFCLVLKFLLDYIITSFLMAEFTLKESYKGFSMANTSSDDRIDWQNILKEKR